MLNMVGTMQELERAKFALIKKINQIEEISEIQEIRTNLSSVFKVKFRNIFVILKIVPYTLSDSQFLPEEYLKYRFEIMINAGKCPVFPKIYLSGIVEYGNNKFGYIFEELFEHNFKEGSNHILSIYMSPLHATLFFFSSVINNFIKLKEYNLLAHRDLSFDNMMYDSEYNLRFIDSGSVKSSIISTTHYCIPAPTKNFYSAPEYSESFSSENIIPNEIYTIALHVMSFIELAFTNSFSTFDCGICKWIKENKYNVDYSQRLSEDLKDKFLTHLLMSYFKGNKEDKLYNLLKFMSSTSLTSRIKDYEIINNAIIKLIQGGHDE